MRFSRFISGLAVAMAFVAGTASATPVPNMVINVTEQPGGGVTVTYSGSVDLSGMQHSGPFANSAAGVVPSNGQVANYRNGLNDFYFNSALTHAPVPFGTGDFSPADTASGSVFEYQFHDDYGADEGFSVPAGYTNGQSLSGSISWTTATFQSLGITPGTYNELVGNNTFQINVGSSAVPEIDPAGMGSVLALVTGALGVLERRRLKVA